jgi:hypothetical protein
MNRIMSHREWMKLTDGGSLSMRSAELKALDAALLAHERVPIPAKKQALVAALHAWINSKGDGWKTSVRNKNNAVENLFRQLGPEGGQTKPDRIALSHVRDESRAIITDLFSGKQLVFRPGLMTKIAGNVSSLTKVSHAKTAIGVGKDIRSLHKLTKLPSPPGFASQIAGQLLDEIIPPEVRADVLLALAPLVPNFVAELSAACAPFVGIAVSGATTVYGLYKVAHTEYKLDQAKMHAQRTLSADEPEAAFSAVTQMLTREANETLASFSVGLAAFGAKLASFLADGGTVTNTAISLTNGLLKLIMLARLAVRDIMERNAANKLLGLPIITVKLFQACPLMGAYLVCCAPTSVIVNTVIDYETFGAPGMMDKVERAVKRHIEPLKVQANRLVTEHRMYIPELQKFAGVIKPDKDALKEMMAKIS